MQKKKKLTLLKAAVLAAVITGYVDHLSASGWFTSSTPTEPSVATISAQAHNLNPKVLKLGMLAYQKAAARGLDKQKILTIVDYSKPSTEKRMWVIDLKRQRVVYNTLVAHGKNSGENYAKHFSNRPSSNASSLGVFLTGGSYSGHHGLSMRLQGLEQGFNSNAYGRAIVMHSAWYVNDNFAHSVGRLGRSDGCFALDKKVEPSVVKTIKGGTVLFAYYPDKNWLSHSQYLKSGNSHTVMA